MIRVFDGSNNELLKEITDRIDVSTTGITSVNLKATINRIVDLGPLAKNFELVNETGVFSHNKLLICDDTGTTLREINNATMSSMASQIINDTYSLEITWVFSGIVGQLFTVREEEPVQILDWHEDGF